MRNADYSCHIYSSCHLVMVVASLAGLRVLLLARVLVQVRVVFLLFVLFVDLVEPAPALLARDARDAGADLLRALRPGPPPLLPPVLPVVLAGERVPFAGLSPERVSPRPSSDLFCGLRTARCAALRVSRRAATQPV